MWVRSLGQEDPLEKGMEAQFSILAWRIPWTEEPGRLQFRRSQDWTRLKWFSPLRAHMHASEKGEKERKALIYSVSYDVHISLVVALKSLSSELGENGLSWILWFSRSWHHHTTDYKGTRGQLEGVVRIRIFGCGSITTSSTLSAQKFWTLTGTSKQRAEGWMLCVVRKKSHPLTLAQLKPAGNFLCVRWVSPSHHHVP